MTLRMVSNFNRNGRIIKVYRDKWGKFWAKNNRRWTQSRMTAEEVVRYLSHIAEDGS